MNLNLFLFLFTAVGVHCVIRNGVPILSALLGLLWQEGTMLIDFDSTKRALDQLKNTHTKEDGELSDEFFESEDYKRLVNDQTRIEAAIPQHQNKISRLVDEFTNLCSHNKNELTMMREDLIDKISQIKLPGKSKKSTRRNKRNKHRLALELRLVEEKERYTALDFDIIQVLRNQADVQGRLIAAHIRGDLEQLECFRQMVDSLRVRLQNIHRHREGPRPRQFPTMNPVPFWNTLSLDDLRRANDWKEIRVRLMQAIDERLMRLSPL